MVQLPHPDLIDFLVERRFPDARRLRFEPSNGQFGDMKPNEATDRLRKIEVFETRLRRMTEAEVSVLYLQEREGAESELEFNQPDFDADMGFWAGLPYWQLDEAAALVLGKDPDKVARLPLFRYTNTKFYTELEQLRELVRRAHIAGQLPDMVAPAAFLGWANQNGLEIPDELVDQIRQCGKTSAVSTGNYSFQSDSQDKSTPANGPSIENTAMLENLMESAAFRELSSMAARAVEGFPSWAEKQNKLQKTGNVETWLEQEFRANSRQKYFLKKVLSDRYKELR